MSEADNGGRISFDAAVRLVQQEPARAAFAALPVFGDDGQAAEGARVFIVETDGKGGWQVRFVAGPFFAGVFGANEILTSDDVPQRVRDMLFMPTRVEQEWFDSEGQIQVLIQKLMQASGQAAPGMPEYESAPAIRGEPGAVPVTFIGRGKGS